VPNGIKILLVSCSGDGAWFIPLLQKGGHQVDWVVSAERDAETLAGLVPKPLSKPPNPSAYDLIVFDTSSMGEAADLARAHTPTIGASKLADQLEHDRVFGIEAMEQAHIKVPKWEAFDNPSAAIAFAKKNNRRYVLKPIGEAPSDCTYVSKGVDDLVHFIETRLDPKVKSFVLQEFVAGTEVSTEAWWTGDQFVALNHTIELKKFMTSDVGPNTGCAGNVVWMPPRSNAIFQQGLERIGPLLKQSNFVGMIDLNTIVTEGDIYGLEWTPRFGYEGTCNLTALLPMEFGQFLYEVAIGKMPTLGDPSARFAATIRLSVPPYPSAEFSRKRVKVPINGIDLDHLENFVLYDVVKEGDQLVTSGIYNCIGSPIGTGDSITAAFASVEAQIKRLDIPNLQYRTDCAKVVGARYDTLLYQGWLRSIG
jgi:phosphoribosylamine-glycine ligase